MERPLLTSLFLILFFTSCDLVTACTQIGCTSGIELRLEEEPSPPYRVEAEAGGGNARYVFECDRAEGCPHIFFSEFTPDHVTFEVIAGADTTWYEVRPTYREGQPNGPGCEPTCLNAVVELPADALTTGPDDT